MRSRYSAYAVADADHLFRTWHPRTRPEHVLGTPGTTWTGLAILDVVDGGPDDATGIVEFRATYLDPASSRRAARAEPLRTPRRPLGLRLPHTHLTHPPKCVFLRAEVSILARRSVGSCGSRCRFLRVWNARTHSSARKNTHLGTPFLTLRHARIDTSAGDLEGQGRSSQEVPTSTGGAAAPPVSSATSVTSLSALAPTAPAPVPGSSPAVARTPRRRVTCSAYVASRTSIPRARSSDSRRPASAWETVELVLDDEHPPPGADLVQPGAYGVPVGPHQAAGAEQHPAEPAGHHHDHVGDLAAAEHLQHRRTRGAGRLAVVAGALHVTGRAEHERRAVVPGVPVPLAQPLHDGPRGRLVGDPLDGAQEARPLHLDLGHDPAGGSEVGRHDHRPSTSPPIRTMNADTTTTKNTRTNRTPRATAIRAPR